MLMNSARLHLSSMLLLEQNDEDIRKKVSLGEGRPSPDSQQAGSDINLKVVVKSTNSDCLNIIKQSDKRHN